MKTSHLLFVGALAAIIGGRADLVADPPARNSVQGDPKNQPAPVAIQQLQVHPTNVKLIGSDASAQLTVTGLVKSSSMQPDLTGEAKYQVADGAVVRVTPSGRVIPLSSGATTVTVQYAANTVVVPVTTVSIEENLPINFPNQIVPIFSKLGCNGGGCHGKSGGQNGFALSLLGFVPELDYLTLVKENRGRRVFPASPDNSLLLLKSAGLMAHGGGKRMETDSDEYKLIRRWIAAGTPWGRPEDPVVTSITIYPEQRIVSRFNRQQIAVYAHYSDGSVNDVTQRAQFESNDTGVAVVDGAGLVRTLDLAGEAAVMARFLGQVATFRATVPLGLKIPPYQFEPKTIVDIHTQKKWQQLGIVPSELCSDEQFIRRVSLDITGTLPTSSQVKAFLTDKNPNKRDRLVDDLLNSQEYSYYFANRWADVLRVRRGNQPDRAFGTFAFHRWIRDSIAVDKPHDQFVQEILAANGDESKSPTVIWYRDLQKPEQFVDDACQLFLGVRMACAQCHHHPYEKWSQDDYWGMAAFFAQIGRKNVPVQGGAPGQTPNRFAIFNKGSGTVTNTRTQQPAVMRALDGEPVTLNSGDDPRHHLAKWMINDKNPFFARAVVNRYWAHFFTHGIVDPVDDMRVTNPPTNPELLDALAKDLIDHKFSLKHLIATICKSRTYQLSAMPNEFNKHDKRSYARFYPRPMSAEVFFDAVCQLTDSPAEFAGLPTDKHSPRRAIMFPDESAASYFLDVFGRPQRMSACECERVSEANLAQALHLANSKEIEKKVTGAGARADQMLKDPRPDAEKFNELFLWAFARLPSQAQVDFFLETIARNPDNRRQAYEDVIWALLNAKEFRLVQ